MQLYGGRSPQLSTCPCIFMRWALGGGRGEVLDKAVHLPVHLMKWALGWWVEERGRGALDTLFTCPFTRFRWS